MRDVKNSPQFDIYTIKTKFSAFAHYYLICDVNLKNIIYQFNSPQDNPIFVLYSPMFWLVYKEVLNLYTVCLWFSIFLGSHHRLVYVVLIKTVLETIDIFPCLQSFLVQMPYFAQQGALSWLLWQQPMYKWVILSQLLIINNNWEKNWGKSIKVKKKFSMYKTTLIKSEKWHFKDTTL